MEMSDPMPDRQWKRLRRSSPSSHRSPHRLRKIPPWRCQSWRSAVIEPVRSGDGGMRRILNRRLFGASLLASTGVLCVQRMRTSGRISDRRRPRSRVAILHADSYARSLDERITDGLRLFGLNLRDKTVLLKPNLVEYIPGAEVNTNPLLFGAAAGAFLALGAKTVVVAEGPGNQRDAYLILAQTGFESKLRDRKLSFVDLNRDDVRQVKVTTPFTGLDSLWIPQSILAADLVVSMPKVKTHH